MAGHDKSYTEPILKISDLISKQKPGIRFFDFLQIILLSPFRAISELLGVFVCENTENDQNTWIRLSEVEMKGQIPDKPIKVLNFET